MTYQKYVQNNKIYIENSIMDENSPLSLKILVFNISQKLNSK